MLRILLGNVAVVVGAAVTLVFTCYAMFFTGSFTLLVPAAELTPQSAPFRSPTAASGCAPTTAAPVPDPAAGAGRASASRCSRRTGKWRTVSDSDGEPGYAGQDSLGTGPLGTRPGRGLHGGVPDPAVAAPRRGPCTSPSSTHRPNRPRTPAVTRWGRRRRPDAGHGRHRTLPVPRRGAVVTSAPLPVLWSSNGHVTPRPAPAGPLPLFPRPLLVCCAGSCGVTVRSRPSGMRVRLGARSRSPRRSCAAVRDRPGLLCRRRRC